MTNDKKITLVEKNEQENETVLTFFSDYQIQKARDQKIIKSNDFLRTLVLATRLSPKEFKILAFIISRIRPVMHDDGELTADEFETITIKIQDMCKILGITYNGKNASDLTRTLKNLSDKSKEINFIKDGREETMLFRWLDTFKTSKGMITLKLSCATMPFLLRLRESFTSYELNNLLVLKGKSIFLFDLLAIEAYRENYTISVDDLKIALQIDDGKYKEYKDFSKRILKPAIEKINELTQLNVTITEHREERKIKYLTFHMSKKESPEERLKLALCQKNVLDGKEAFSETEKKLYESLIMKLD